jgi:transglutaminase-like putative cysteine protease
MPYPQQFEAQSGVRLLASTPEVSWMNAPRYPMRSLYFEQPSQGERETVFQADYEMTTWARYNPIDPAKILPINRRHPVWGYFTSETTRHVAFTPEIQDLGRNIVQGERNPYLKAHRIYDWMSKNIQYSYAREYSTLRNISLYPLHHRYGDCGQLALLFIALCRSQGIPARWQSGWMIYPPLKNLHDWSEIYLEPYGWIPVDVNFAQMIEQDFESLSRDEREELKDSISAGWIITASWLTASMATITFPRRNPSGPTRSIFSGASWNRMARTSFSSGSAFGATSNISMTPMRSRGKRMKRVPPRRDWRGKARWSTPFRCATPDKDSWESGNKMEHPFEVYSIFRLRPLRGRRR